MRRRSPRPAPRQHPQYRHPRPHRHLDRRADDACELDDGLRIEVARRWTATAQDEAAAVIAFEELAEDLAAIGAPAATATPTAPLTRSRGGPIVDRRLPQRGS